MTTAITRSEKGAAYYDAIYSRGYSTEAYEPIYRGILTCLKGYVAPRPRILEIGCGCGDMAGCMLSAGYDYCGFDFSPEAVRIAGERFPDGDFFVGDAYAFASYARIDYNTVIALEVLEHLGDLEVIERIKPGSRVIASVPDYWDESHLRVYSDPKRDIIERYGGLLHVTRIGSVSFPPGATSDRPTVYIFEAIRLAP